MTHVYKIDIHQSSSLILKYRFQPLAENGGLIETNRWIYFTDIIREEMVPSAMCHASRAWCQPFYFINCGLIRDMSCVFCDECCHLEQERWAHLKCIQGWVESSTYGQLQWGEELLNTSSSQHPTHAALATLATFYWHQPLDWLSQMEQCVFLAWGSIMLIWEQSVGIDTGGIFSY